MYVWLIERLVRCRVPVRSQLFDISFQLSYLILGYYKAFIHGINSVDVT